MRLAPVIAISLIVLTTSGSYAASVLVPGDSKGGNLGLSPTTQQNPQATTPPQSVMLPKSEVMPPAAPQPAIAAANSSLDSVNTDLLKSVRIEELKNYLPPEMQNLSNEDMNKLLNYNFDRMRQIDYSKYIKTDPKTGEQTVDFDSIGKEAEPQTRVQITTGGGRIQPKVMTKQERAIAEFAAQGKDIKQHPVIEKAMAMAAAEREMEEKKRERDPLFLKDLDMEAFETPFMKSTIAIGLAKDYVWGQEALAIVNRTMGYEGEEILSNCQLRLNIHINTDDNNGLYKMALYSNTQKNLKYDGLIKGIDATPLAVCAKPTKALPRHGDIIFKIGDKYGISVPKATCTAPAPDPNTKKMPTTVLIAYTGDSKIECLFK